MIAIDIIGHTAQKDFACVISTWTKHTLNYQKIITTSKLQYNTIFAPACEGLDRLFILYPLFQSGVYQSS